MAKSTGEFNLFYHDCLEASYRASSSAEEYLRQNEIYFEVQVTPNNPHAERIAPVTIRSDYILGPDGIEPEQLHPSANPAQAAHKSLLKKAFYIRKKLKEQYKGKNYSVHITWKMAKK